MIPPGQGKDCKFAAEFNAMTARNPFGESRLACRWGPPTAQWRSSETYSFPQMNPEDGCWKFEKQNTEAAHEPHRS